MNPIIHFKNKKAQLMELIFKEFTIGFLVGVVVTLVVVVILLRNGVISADMLSQILPASK